VKTVSLGRASFIIKFIVRYRKLSKLTPTLAAFFTTSNTIYGQLRPFTFSLKLTVTSTQVTSICVVYLDTCQIWVLFRNWTNPKLCPTEYWWPIIQYSAAALVFPLKVTSTPVTNICAVYLDACNLLVLSRDWTNSKLCPAEYSWPIIRYSAAALVEQPI